MRGLSATVAAALVVALSGSGASGVAQPQAGSLGPSEWLGSRSTGAAQDGVAPITLPSRFASANLLVALVASDGPDSVPGGDASNETTAVFSDPAGLVWTRAAHVSARRDVAHRGQALEQFGASIAEVWTATPPPAWDPAHDTISVTNNHPNQIDDGFFVTIAAFAHGRLAESATIDGMAKDVEQLTLSVPNGSAIYAATFAGRRNADFTPVAGFHRAGQRRAGDDTAGVIASNSRGLHVGMHTVGYTAPTPGDYWEIAAAVISPSN